MAGGGDAPRGFTGRHMAGAITGFFAVVIGVNLTMAVLATMSFGGKVVDNSYVASQRFNGWLAEARAQDDAGWQAGFAADAGHVVITSRPGSRVEAVASHPLGRAPERALSFVEQSPGRYRAAERLPAGRWQLRATIWAKPGRGKAGLDKADGAAAPARFAADVRL
ncbi:hypothetical protein GVO57_10600 [Sphingomonas changnyeongensis]|uniref:Nitrogen fixation protein FixH n=2 Tax=Sphingomonas changnyeongensis TaxID=2698679 RepID=A0A7Z2NY19_9SPHN|nr:hypothetical protein GVO57_10600 [Sphingomonas changnyeongensis]